MSLPDKKDDFEWEEGRVLDDKSVTPIPEVRVKGLPKISKAVHADPALRKEERDKKILENQSQPYRPQSTPQGDNEVIFEETHSGLSSEIEKQDTERLLDKGKQFRGLDRFGGQRKDGDEE